MIEIENKGRSPIQLVVRSKKAPRAFTTLIVPGIGSGNNIKVIEDERHTDVIDRIERMGLITTRYLPNDNNKNSNKQIS
jgi:hypothetical protein